MNHAGPKLLLLLLLFPLCTCVRAQIGLHPPRVDFKVIETDHAKVIFPAGFAGRAQRVGAMLDRLQENHTQSIGEKIYDVDLVLQTATTRVNGYVALAPFRSEFFSTPPQSMNLLSGTDWVDLLTIHEYRHVQQVSNERRGITKLFSYLQGQNGWSVLSFLATPNWFAEGDATLIETALSGGGRGRTPAFSAAFRSLLDEGIIYRYAKARNGSFDELVPDHYRYGYNALAWARERYGNDVWKGILHDGAAYKGLFYPFSRALKKATGFKPRGLFKASQEDLQRAMAEDIAARGTLVEGEAIDDGATDIINYRMPFVDDRGRVIALQSGFKMTPRLVVIDPEGGKPKRLTSVGIQREPYYHLRGNTAVWHETRQHPRFTNEVYSDIVRYDLAYGRKQKLTTNGKFFAPALSFDRQRIVAVFHDPTQGGPELVIMASNTGEVQERYRIDAQAVSFPRFSADGKRIYYYHRAFDGVALHVLELGGGKDSALEEPTFEARDYLQVTADNKLIYSSGRDGVDNVYLLDPENGSVEQLTNVKIQAVWPQLVGDKLYYTGATPRGERLYRLAINPTDGYQKALRQQGPRPVRPSVFRRPEAFAEEAEDLTQTVPQKEYPVANYSDKLGGVRLHSWSFNGSYINPGLIVEAGNALNTVRISAEAQYDYDEARTTTGLSVDYGGFFPVLSLAANTRGRVYNTLSLRPDSIIVSRSTFDQQVFSASVGVPLQWIAGDYVTSFEPRLTASHLRIRDQSEGPLMKDFNAIGWQLNLRILHRLARKHVQPRFGVTLRSGYDQALGDQDGHRFFLRSELYLPSVFPTHGFRLDFELQDQDVTTDYQYPNAIQFARGYGSSLSDRATRIGVNYQLPLLYPDFGILGITYFQRIRLNAFFDHTQLEIEGVRLGRPQFSSVGGQLFFDNVWMNSAPITLGVEGAYLLDPLSGQNQLQFRILASGGF